MKPKTGMAQALPGSGWLYRLNGFTGTPVNTVIYDAFFSILLGLLVFAGPQAINAVFSLSVVIRSRRLTQPRNLADCLIQVALYIAYSIPIAARFVFHQENSFKPGPYTLGQWVSPFEIYLHLVSDLEWTRALLLPF